MSRKPSSVVMQHDPLPARPLPGIAPERYLELMRKMFIVDYIEERL